MTSGATAERADDDVQGGTRLEPADDREAFLDAAHREGLLEVELPALGPTWRGHLRHAFELAIEAALETCNAAPPAAEGYRDLDASLCDQLYRARGQGAQGLAIWVPELFRIANLAGTLEAEDSAVLRWWLRASTERPVRLGVDQRNRWLGVYGLPVDLELLLDASSPAPPALAPAGPTRAMEQLDLDFCEPLDDPEPARPSEPGLTPIPSGAAPPRSLSPLSDSAAREWRGWVKELEQARGPKSLGAVERLFVTRYVPLADAYRCGITEPEVWAVLESWATSFRRSYEEAFEALCARGKRPTMVLDLPDVALRIARLHSAHSTQLFLVDGLRFDVGLRLHEYLRSRVGTRAVPVERLLAWSALPTTTAVQLDLLGRGPDALRDFDAMQAAEPPVARGLGATVPRRIRAGQRELFKLDVIEARATEPEGTEPGRLDAAAQEAADAIADHFASLTERTLVLLFGDHGFTADARGRIRQGGGSPEEVLVPAFAWLVGDMQ